MNKIPLTMDEIHQLLREALSIIDSASKETGTVYYLHAGTALGAIRHCDLIPWDEDADVIIPLPGYIQLINYLKNKDLGKFNLLYREKRATRMQAKMVLKGQDEDLICVDLFPLIGFPKDKNEQVKLDSKAARIRRIYAYKRLEYTESSNFAKKLIKKIISLLLSVYTDKYLYSQFDYIMYKYDFESSELVTNPCGKYSLKNIIPKSWYGTPRYHEFGDAIYPIPSSIHEYLSHYYGEYLKVPSPEVQSEMVNNPKYFVGTQKQYNDVFSY